MKRLISAFTTMPGGFPENPRICRSGSSGVRKPASRSGRDKEKIFSENSHKKLYENLYNIKNRIIFVLLKNQEHYEKRNN